MAQYKRRPRIDVVTTSPRILTTKKRKSVTTSPRILTTKRKSDDVEATASNQKRQRSIEEFEMLDKIGEGTYGIVYRARDKRRGEIVAMKKVKIDDGKEELSEINILARLRHPSIVDLKYVVASGSGSFTMTMEYVENDVRSVLGTMKQQGFSQSETKCLMQQLLQGVGYIHRNKVIHRDLKPSNLLLNNHGGLKICDFGIACRFNNNDFVAHTEKVVSLWYRAPELLLRAKHYSTAIDMWSVGCIMAELLSGKPLFDGDEEVDQLGKMFKILGTPNEAIWPGFSKLPGASNFIRRRSERSLLRERFPAVSFTGLPMLSNAGFDLLSSLLTYDPTSRITAEEALNHPWFREVPLPKSKDFMPTFPPSYVRKSQSQQQSGTGLFGL